MPIVFRDAFHQFSERVLLQCNGLIRVYALTFSRPPPSAPPGLHTSTPSRFHTSPSPIRPFSHLVPSHAQSPIKSSLAPPDYRRTAILRGLQARPEGGQGIGIVLADVRHELLSDLAAQVPERWGILGTRDRPEGDGPF